MADAANCDPRFDPKGRAWAVVEENKMKNAEPVYDEDEVVRCRNVRDYLDRRFKTVEAYCAWLEQRDRKRKAAKKIASKSVARQRTAAKAASSKARVRASVPR
jgi:hypothetical protein